MITKFLGKIKGEKPTYLEYVLFNLGSMKRSRSFFDFSELYAHFYVYMGSFHSLQQILFTSMTPQQGKYQRLGNPSKFRLIYFQ